MGKTSFSGPVNSAAGFVGDVVGAIKLPTFTVATAPSAVTAGAGTVIYVSNGRAGLPTVAVSDGTNWISSAGIAIATS
jgi:hypothetical protein